MIKKFFQRLNSQGVSYLLISGQAAILYGAATFSEDIDLWVEPEIENWIKFLRLLRDIKAKIYKLTPPFSMTLIRNGHGYHFQLPSGDKKLPVWFLDVMGAVPRVSSFKKSFKDAIYKETDWGKLPVIRIRDLVEIKKTRRLEDYTVISNLVRIEYENLSSKKIGRKDWEWILTNSFEVEDILYYFRTHSLARNVGSIIPRKYLSICLKAIDNHRDEEKCIDAASKEIALEIENLRSADRKYWEPVISKLKSMRWQNQLLVPGSEPPDSVKF